MGVGIEAVVTGRLCEQVPCPSGRTRGEPRSVAWSWLAILRAVEAFRFWTRVPAGVPEVERRPSPGKSSCSAHTAAWPFVDAGDAAPAER